MKLEIDLDLNQIDYEAINKQIQDKIAAMDLKKEYQISTKIDSQIREATEREVNYYFRNGTWGGLNNDSKREIKDEITKNIRELIQPHVENIFNQLPQEELNKLISELLPKVLMDLICSNMQNVLTSYYYSAENTVMQLCDRRINDLLGRPGY